MDRLRDQRPYIANELLWAYRNNTDRLPNTPPNNYNRDRRAQRAYHAGGFSASYNNGSFNVGFSYGYRGNLPERRRNWRYINVTHFYGGNGTDYRPRLYYERLDARTFPAVLDELANGIFGALMVWPDKPGIVAHSAALEKFFYYMDRRITARLAYADGVSQNRRLAMAKEMVKETLAPLVDSVTVIEGEYQVRFRLSNGRKSPWVHVPMVFFEGNVPWNGNGRNLEEGFRGVGPFTPYTPAEEPRTLSNVSLRY
jgi:hypothetical protein